jgi:hypothetical protein
MDAMRGLAYGLRQAGGVLNPDVQRQTSSEDADIEKTRQAIVNQDAMMRKRFELEQQTPEAQMKRQMLANENAFRVAALEANGDMAKIAGAAMQFGKPEIAMNIYKSHEDRTAKLQQHRETLAAKEQELRMRMEDRQATREQQLQYQQAMLGLRQQSIALQGEIAKGNQQLQGMRIEMMGDKVQRDRERERHQITQKLGVAFEKSGLTEMETVVGNAEKAVSDDKILEYVNGPKSSIPDLVLSKDITNARQAVAMLFNVTLKNRSGAAVTNQELERLKKEFGAGVFKKPEQLREAVTRAREIIDNHYRGIASGFGATALDDYNKNAVEIGGKPVLAPSGGGWSIKAK